MSKYVVKKTPGDTSWFLHDRFGMFIHWGLYSMPARHEWCKSRDVSARNNYDKYFKYFDPDMYDPKQWARDAKNAGMKVCGVYDDSSKEYVEEMKAATDHYIYDFAELPELNW